MGKGYLTAASLRLKFGMIKEMMIMRNEKQMLSSLINNKNNKKDNKKDNNRVINRGENKNGFYQSTNFSSTQRII